ncbi:hypothetical protein ASD11_04570 [Aeromicrobium sp. Root495]|uniref:hypothetical protein n=1 Tax=Aeromicrobium sp. Root495 TaxID=1736550 RepID=UPI0006F49689|nr:hypothetical protein [Aeromicrobium sp. Root495]KQY58907.1 hypothetical protein ASD11_04570 [Aeromicrobium sp. Root495]
MSGLVCPEWCDGPQDSTVHAGGGSTHIAKAGGQGGYGTTIYQRVDDGQWLMPVSYSLLADLQWRGTIALDDLTADDCREMAAALNAAADKLESAVRPRASGSPMIALMLERFRIYREGQSTLLFEASEDAAYKWMRLRGFGKERAEDAAGSCDAVVVIVLNEDGEEQDSVTITSDATVHDMQRCIDALTTLRDAVEAGQAFERSQDGPGST